MRAIKGCGSDDQAHHIIPSQWTFPTGSNGYKHPLVQKAALSGFHPNDWYNGVCLPTTQHHYHPKYNEYVQFQLNEFHNTFVGRPPYSPYTANKWLQCKLIPHLLGLVTNIPAGTTINDYFTPINNNRQFIGTY